MPTFTENFGFKESPFEQYVAEREPRIDEYAVKPPYFEETRRRVASVTSYLLFGFRGSGKLATRITTEKETWKEIGVGSKGALLVSLIDFDSILRDIRVDDVTLGQIVKRVAFLTVEAILLWISNQEEKDSILELLDEVELKNLRYPRQSLLSNRARGGSGCKPKRDDADSSAKLEKHNCRLDKQKMGEYCTDHWSSCFRSVERSNTDWGYIERGF